MASWWERAHGDPDFLVAYFSLEFGVDERLPVYAGGLGVLAGDHLKAAADLGIPLVGVGLFYRAGYFRQDLSDGGQRERYDPSDPSRVGLVREHTIEISFSGEGVAVAVWKAQVGDVRLYLLDTEVEGNSEHARAVTGALYGGDREQRLRQEILLGVGGVHALEAAGLRPTVFHMNEGHAAFLVLARLRALVNAGRSLGDAFEHVRATTVFTTHTPVPAGNERFDPALIEQYLREGVAGLGLSWEEFLSLGRPGHPENDFGLTPFALRTAGRANAVSQRHGEVSRRMWAALWPERPVEEVPIGQVTNGVHAPTWLGSELALLLREAGVKPEAAPAEQGWGRAESIESGALWRSHRARKASLMEFADRQSNGSRLDPDALTIGFARRFAGYKRAGLVFSDLDRLARLLTSTERPVQLLLAGKAHPADAEGKALVSLVLSSCADPRLGGRAVFLEDYDIGLAQALVQGVDVWLNTPRPPEEASGTSGMKAAMNGSLNLSTLDGWWWEAYTPASGWAIDGGSSSDEEDAAELYRLLEEEVVPGFYERDADGLPARWLGMMKASISQLSPRFNAGRMVCEYVERFYLPAHRSGR